MGKQPASPFFIPEQGDDPAFFVYIGTQLSTYS